MMPNLVLGNSSATLASAVAQAKPRHHDRAEAVLGEFAQDLLALGVVLDFEVAEGDAGLLAEFGRAVEDALVEGFVELAAEIIDDGGLDVGGVGRGGSEETAGAKRGAQEQRRERA